VWPGIKSAKRQYCEFFWPDSAYNGEDKSLLGVHLRRILVRIVVRILRTARACGLDCGHRRYFERGDTTYSPCPLGTGKGKGGRVGLADWGPWREIRACIWRAYGIVHHLAKHKPRREEDWAPNES